MALIDTTTLLGIADRAAKQFEIFQTAFDSYTAVGTDLYATRITETDNIDLEIITLADYNRADNPSFAQTVRNMLPFNVVIGAMTNHFNQQGQLGGWDGYLTSNDIRVSSLFNQLYRIITRFYMLANNVFSETDDTFATIDRIGGPSLTFTDGVNYGTGASANLAQGGNFASTQLKVVVTTMGGTDLDLRLSVKDKNDLPTTIDVTVPASSVGGTEIDVGISTDRFLDVISVAFVPAGNMGTAGDEVEIHNKKERTISL